MKNYIAYAAKILREAKANSTNIVPQRVIITGEGSGLSMAVSVAEILKRMFADDLRLEHPGTNCENISSSSSSPPTVGSPLHQLNSISMQSTSLVYEPLEEGLDPVHVNKVEPRIEIRLAWTIAALTDEDEASGKDNRTLRRGNSHQWLSAARLFSWLSVVAVIFERFQSGLACLHYQSRRPD